MENRLNYKYARCLWGLLFLLLYVALCLPQSALANSAEPPGLIVIIAFPAEDLALSLMIGDKVMPLEEIRTAWEAQYRYHYFGSASRPGLEAATIIVSSGESYWELPLPAYTHDRYNNILSLDLRTGALTQGKTLLRSVTLVSIRVLSTILIEGLVFFVFGYRRRYSWIVFLLVNVLTQSCLNIMLNQTMIASAYLIFGLILYELVVFIIEILSFLFLLKEHGPGRSALFALVANFLSLILGGLLITHLPV